MHKFIEMRIVKSNEQINSDTNMHLALINADNEMNLIPMIKVLRELTGSDLAPAKDFAFNFMKDFRTFNKSRVQLMEDIKTELKKMEKHELRKILNNLNEERKV